MNPKRPKVEPIRQPTLFQMEKLEEAPKPASELKIERPYFLPGILPGTSDFTANGWQGSFYPPGMNSRDFLSYYVTQFATVEVDSTFYGCPSASTETPEQKASALGVQRSPWMLLESIHSALLDIRGAQSLA